MINFLKNIFFNKENQNKLDTFIFDSLNNNFKTILFVTGTIPTYDKDSGSNRLKEIILAYKELGYNCILAYNKSENDEKYTSYFKGIGTILFNDLNNKHKTQSLLNSVYKIDYIWFNGPNTLKKQFEIFKKNASESITIYDMVDIHFLRYKRAIELEPNKISIRKKYFKYFKIETELAKKVDYVIAISVKEKKVMSEYLDENKIITISNIHYSKIDKNLIKPFEEREDLLFIGSSHAPNIDALYFLYQEIMPIVWEKLPNLKVNVIGNLDTEITDIIHPNFIFHGYVPEIESHFNNAKFMIAPLRYGAGVKGKIGQAFEYYLPVITTKIGAEGMHLKNNENVLIADESIAFANYIIQLHDNSALWDKLSQNSENSLLPFSREILKETLQKL